MSLSGVAVSVQVRGEWLLEIAPSYYDVRTHDVEDRRHVKILIREPPNCRNFPKSEARNQLERLQALHPHTDALFEGNSETGGRRRTRELRSSCNVRQGRANPSSPSTSETARVTAPTGKELRSLFRSEIFQVWREERVPPHLLENSASREPYLRREVRRTLRGNVWSAWAFYESVRTLRVIRIHSCHHVIR